MPLLDVLMNLLHEESCNQVHPVRCETRSTVAGSACLIWIAFIIIAIHSRFGPMPQPQMQPLLGRDGTGKRPSLLGVVEAVLLM
jgi:hypothetical protein